MSSSLSLSTLGFAPKEHLGERVPHAAVFILQETESFVDPMGAVAYQDRTSPGLVRLFESYLPLELSDSDT
jgi:hypothetical protein